MKRAKRALAFLLAFILLTSVLAGCGRKEEPADKTEDITGDITDTGDENRNARAGGNPASHA